MQVKIPRPRGSRGDAAGLRHRCGALPVRAPPELPRFALLAIRRLGALLFGVFAACARRDDGMADQVKLGLVEQSVALNGRFIDRAQGFDAVMARHEERLRSQDERMRALEQLLRERVARSPVPP